MDPAFTEREELRINMIRNAVCAARGALKQAGMAPDKIYCIYVPSGASGAITEALDPCDMIECATRVRRLHGNIVLVRPSSAAEKARIKALIEEHLRARTAPKRPASPTGEPPAKCIAGTQ